MASFRTNLTGTFFNTTTKHVTTTCSTGWLMRTYDQHSQGQATSDTNRHPAAASSPSPPVSIDGYRRVSNRNLTLLSLPALPKNNSATGPNYTRAHESNTLWCRGSVMYSPNPVRSGDALRAVTIARSAAVTLRPRSTGPIALAANHSRHLSRCLCNERQELKICTNLK